MTALSVAYDIRHPGILNFQNFFHSILTEGCPKTDQKWSNDRCIICPVLKSPTLYYILFVPVFLKKLSKFFSKNALWFTCKKITFRVSQKSIGAWFRPNRSKKVVPSKERHRKPPKALWDALNISSWKVQNWSAFW